MTTELSSNINLFENNTKNLDSVFKVARGYPFV